MTPKYVECIWYLNGVTQLETHFTCQWTSWKTNDNDSVCIHRFSSVSWCKMPRTSQLYETWETHIKYLVQSKEDRELHNLAGHPEQFGWRNYSRTHHNDDFTRDQENDGREITSPSEFQGRIIFMSMFNDIEWWAKQNESKCSENSVEVATCARDFAQGRWSFLGSGDVNTWYGTSDDKPKGKWNALAHKMIEQFQTSGRPVLLCSDPLETVSLHARGKETFHFNADSSSPELLMTTILAVDQLTTYHAVSIWYNRVQKMHDVSTACHHWDGRSNARASCDLPPTRIRVRRSFKRSCTSHDGPSGTNIGDETVHVIDKLGYSRRSAKSTQEEEM